MGQIANQMLIDWCCKMVQKIKDKKDKKRIYEKADVKRGNRCEEVYCKDEAKI